MSCGNNVTWPSGRLMNHSITIPAKVLMNNLHCAASEPPTSIICVSKAARWASGSSIPVKVTLGPMSVTGITNSTISVENGVGNSLGGVTGPDLHPHSQSCGFAGFCVAPPSWLMRLPNQLGCVLDLFLMRPLPPEGFASSS